MLTLCEKINKSICLNDLKVGDDVIIHQQSDDTYYQANVCLITNSFIRIKYGGSGDEEDFLLDGWTSKKLLLMCVLVPMFISIKRKIIHTKADYSEYENYNKNLKIS